MEKVFNVIMRGQSVINAGEAMFIIVAPVFVYGWIKGLLIASALTSIFGTCQLLKRFVGIVEQDRREAQMLAAQRQKELNSKIVKPR